MSFSLRGRSRTDRVVVNAQKLPLRKDIQALRAIAVLAVVVSHFIPEKFPGGYVGVDIFFVVSGFLITSHLLKEVLTTGKLDFARFYIRRAKRLLPAAFLVTLVSAFATLLLLPSSRWGQMLVEAIFSTVYLQNWQLAARSVDYSAQAQDATMVQHYWSLSVEEQFYLFWPALLVLVCVLAARLGVGRRRFSLYVLLVVFAASFLWAVVFTAQNRAQAYFVTTTRVWEFAAGAIVAVALPVLGRFFVVDARAGRLLSWVAQLVGLALIAFSLVTFDELTPFPGPMALLPVVGTALIIAAGPEIGKFSLLRPLSIRPVQFIGRISYSLYLWHWPLLILCDYVTAPLTGRNRYRLLAVGLSFVLAWLTERFVEQPGRFRLLRSASKRRAGVVFVVSEFVMVAVFLGGFVYSSNYVPPNEKDHRVLVARGCEGAAAVEKKSCGDPYSGFGVVPVTPDDAPWFVPKKCRAAEGEVRCEFVDGPAANILLLGDSHAEHWQAALTEAARRHGWNVRMRLLGGCPSVGVPLIDDVNTAERREHIKECLAFSGRAFAAIAAQKPDLVVISNYTSSEYLYSPEGLSQAELYADGLAKIRDVVAEYGGKVLVVRDIPLNLGKATPECVALSRFDVKRCATLRAESLVPDAQAEGAVSLNDSAVRVADFSDYFCDERSCYATLGGLGVYYDHDHLSRSLSKTFAGVLAAEVEKSLGL